MILMLKFIVHKENEDLDVLLLRHKNTEKWSYVNLTKGHICSCIFDSIEDAIKDMDDRKEKGLLLSYEVVN